MNASVKIAVIDACGSGAITRMKGGVAVPAFMVDASSDMNGYAFITSSTQMKQVKVRSFTGIFFYSFFSEWASWSRRCEWRWKK